MKKTLKKLTTRASKTSGLISIGPNESSLHLDIKTYGNHAKIKNKAPSSKKYVLGYIRRYRSI